MQGDTLTHQKSRWLQTSWSGHYFGFLKISPCILCCMMTWWDELRNTRQALGLCPWPPVVITLCCNSKAVGDYVGLLEDSCSAWIAFCPMVCLCLCGFLFPTFFYCSFLFLVLGFVSLSANLIASEFVHICQQNSVLQCINCAFSRWISYPSGLALIGWSSICATNMFVDGLGMADQRYLILYPITLLYSMFALISIFWCDWQLDSLSHALPLTIHLCNFSGAQSFLRYDVSSCIPSTVPMGFYSPLFSCQTEFSHGEDQLTQSWTPPNPSNVLFSFRPVRRVFGENRAIWKEHLPEWSYAFKATTLNSEIRTALRGSSNPNLWNCSVWVSARSSGNA